MSNLSSALAVLLSRGYIRAMKNIVFALLVSFSFLACGQAVLGDGRDAPLALPLGDNQVSDGVATLPDLQEVTPVDVQRVDARDEMVMSAPDVSIARDVPAPTDDAAPFLDEVLVCGSEFPRDFLSPFMVETCSNRGVETPVSLVGTTATSSSSLLPECTGSLRILQPGVNRAFIQLNPIGFIDRSSLSLVMTGRLGSLRDQGMVIRLRFLDGSFISVSRWVWGGPGTGGVDVDRTGAPRDRWVDATLGRVNTEWFNLSMNYNRLTGETTISVNHQGLGMASRSYTIPRSSSRFPTIEIENWGYCDSSSPPDSELLGIRIQPNVYRGL